MSAKRSYWAGEVENPNRHINFCETSVVDMRGGRARFEAILKSRLQKAGFRVERRPEIELFEDVVRKRISRIAQMCVGFIQRAKKNNMSPEDLLTLSRDVNKNDERSFIFVQFAASVYNRYEIEKRRQGYIDFDDILVQARQIVVNREGRVPVRKTRESEISLQNLKYVFIDEYQDFSPLFYELVKTIRDFNQQIKFFCVGDDWQAINKFAGSDLKYFNNFPGFFSGASAGSLVQNYRSVEEIVDLGNRLMGNRGTLAKATRKGQKALVATVDVGKVFVEKRQGPAYQIQYQDDLRFRSVAQVGEKTIDTDPFCDIARRLKAIHTIILDPIWDYDTTFAVLARTGSSKGTKLKELEAKLRLLPSVDERRRVGRLNRWVNKGNDRERKLRVDTVHRFKGLEADVVIILDVISGRFPLIHPDSQLYRVFGDTPESILEDERRLFYVGISRPRKGLYLLTEKGKEAAFLQEIAL